MDGENKILFSPPRAALLGILSPIVPRGFQLLQRLGKTRRVVPEHRTAHGQQLVSELVAS